MFQFIAENANHIVFYNLTIRKPTFQGSSKAFFYINITQYN